MSLAAVAEPVRVAAGTRVLHVITRLDRGGSADNTLLTCLGLDERGWQVTLAYGRTREPSPLLREVERRENIACLRIPELVREIHPLSDLKAYRSIRRLLLSGDYDLVHTHSSKAGLLGRRAAAGLHCRVVHTPHGHVFHGYFGSVMTRLIVGLERRAAAWCDRIVVLTDRGREEHLERGVGQPEQYVTIPSGVPLNGNGGRLPARDAARMRFGLPCGAKVIGCVARLTAIKGQKVLLDAAARLAGHRGDVHVLLVGDGESRAALGARAAELGISSRVTFAGALPDARDALAAIDVFVLPSLNEGQGRAVIEAMAAGVPVVASAVGGVPEVLDGGRCGVLVAPGDPDALASAIESLAESPEKAASLVRAGRTRARDYDDTTMLDKIESLYRNLLREATP